jgi:Flp pilus assembly protein TadG
MRARLRATRTLAASRERGQVIVIFAVFMIVLMVLAGSAYDYASIVTDDAKLQNAVDAATLAGADALGRNATLPRATVEAKASATAGRFLELNGVTAGQGTTVNMAFPTSTPVPPSLTPGPYLDNLRISVTRDHPTAFWPLIGINNVSMNSSGSARAARGMVDAWLSLDTTFSMVMTDSMDALRDATKAFINELIPEA